MPYRKKDIHAGGYYHVFNRGANRDRIFYDRNDYMQCISLLHKYTLIIDVSLIAYSLIPNHYHLVLRQNSEKSISDYIRIVFNAYVQSFNKRHFRKGTLFESRFKHKHVDSDSYLKHLCRYIHLNPVMANLVSRPEDWPYSNYRDWVDPENHPAFDQNPINAFFASPDEYQKFVMEFVFFPDEI